MTARHEFPPGSGELWSGEVDRENVRLPRAMRNHGGGGHGQRSLRCPSPLGNVFETWGTWDCLPREAVP